MARLANMRGGFSHPPQDCVMAEPPVPAGFVARDPAVPREFADGILRHRKEIRQLLDVEDFPLAIHHCFISVSDRYFVGLASGATRPSIQKPLIFSRFEGPGQPNPGGGFHRRG